MKHIIAHGGAGFASAQRDLLVERYLLEQSNTSNPKICFLPQASAESSDYIVRFFEAFTTLNAKPSWLSLFGKVNRQWKEQLLSQDIIYVGGGNTRSLLALWREWGVDEVLKEAYEQGIVLCGISAGAICWFEECVTDSVYPLGTLKGLGILPGSCCPHYNSEADRKPTYEAHVNAETLSPGLALDDQTAAHFIDGKLHQAVSANPECGVYRVTKNQQEKIPTTLLG